MEMLCLVSSRDADLRQRVLLMASRVIYASASPSSSAAVEEMECPGTHTKGQVMFLCLECVDLHSGCSVQGAPLPILCMQFPTLVRDIME